MFLDFLNNNTEDRLDKLLDRMYENPNNFTTIKTYYPAGGDNKDMRNKNKFSGYKDTNMGLGYGAGYGSPFGGFKEVKPAKHQGMGRPSGYGIFADPFEDIDDISNRLGEFNKSDFKINIKRTKEAYELEAELPGVKKENITLEVMEDMVLISVDQADEVEEKKKNYIVKEIKERKFSRAEYLGKDIDRENVKAKLEDGILKVTIGRIQEPETDYTVTIE